MLPNEKIKKKIFKDELFLLLPKKVIYDEEKIELNGDLGKGKMS